jgi:hypothetical protein
MNEIIELAFGWCIALTVLWLFGAMIRRLICPPPPDLPPPSEDAKRGTGNW